jgi:hypothetical protein
METPAKLYDAAQIDRLLRDLDRKIDANHEEGWRDILGQIVVRAAGAGRPTWSQINSTNFWAYQFAVNDVSWIHYHIPHDYVPGSDIHIHTHWLPDGTDANSVKWEYQYSYAKGFDQEAFALGSPTTINAEQAVSTPTQYQHMVTETAAITIAGLTEPDGFIMVRIKRVTNGATDNADGIFVLTSDVHYRSDSKSTLGKAPDFYTK